MLQEVALALKKLPFRRQMPSLHGFVYAGWHPAGRRFLPGNFVAEHVSWCGAISLKSVLNGRLCACKPIAIYRQASRRYR